MHQTILLPCQHGKLAGKGSKVKITFINNSGFHDFRNCLVSSIVGERGVRQAGAVHGNPGRGAVLKKS